MKAEDFINLVNGSISPESRLRRMTANDLKRWTEMGFFKHAPEYYRAGDFEIAIALLKNEADLAGRVSSPVAHSARTYKTAALEVAFQTGIVQVVTCVGSNLYIVSENGTIQAIKLTDT